MAPMARVILGSNGLLVIRGASTLGKCVGVYANVWECMQMCGSVCKCVGVYVNVWECMCGQEV